VNFTIVITTIHVPNLLVDFAKNFLEHNQKNTSFIVIGDKKTPHEKCKEICNKVEGMGIQCEYFDILDQEKWLKEFPKLAEIIPYNSDNRRNIGHLMAYQRKSNLIQVDDDNFPTDDNFIKYHSVVGNKIKAKSVSSSNKWYNTCEPLETSTGRKIYPRGFPFARRRNEILTYDQDEGFVAANMGLWLNVPDADVITHLADPVTITKVRSKEPLIISRGNLCPINSQNTAIFRDAIPCFYYVLQNEIFNGITLDRFGDIWQGFFAKKVIDAVGHKVTVGGPIVNHRRNPHNYFDDLKFEFYGMLVTEKLADILERIELNSRNYVDGYLELAEILDKTEIYPDINVQKYFKKVTNCMRIWLETCDKLK
jgi:hypothetical protein